MITSIKAKKILSNTLFVVISWINKLMKHDPQRVLHYINLEWRDNTKAVFDFMERNGYHKNYKSICACLDYKKYQSLGYKNVRFISKTRAILEFLRAGKVFYSIGHLPIEPAKDQEVLQMWHGVPYKNCDISASTHTFKRQYYTKVLSTAKHFMPILHNIFSISKEKIVIGGYPRCEALFQPSPDYDLGEYKKIVLWAPTFRKSTQIGMTDVDTDMIVPVLEQKDFIEINDYLKTIGVKIIIKLHPVQDLSKYNLVNMDNFILMSHEEFINRKMDLYRFMAQCDALITDYSSIFFDYLLLDRPIGFTTDDEEKYGNNRGFSVNNPESYKPGLRIKTKEDLMKFCKDLADNKDDYKSERERVNKLANDCRDGHFCEKILNVMGVLPPASKM